MTFRPRVAARVTGVNQPSRHPSFIPLISSLSILLHVLTPATASAGEDPCPTPEEGEQNAREHYARGEAAFKVGHYETALSEFEAGFVSSSRPGFLLDMAHTERRLGDLREARALYKKYLLVDPSSKLRVDVMAVIAEIDSALADEDLAGARGRLGRRPPIEAPAGVPSAPAPAPEGPQLVASQSTSSISGESDGTTSVYHRGWFWLTVGLVIAAGTGVAIYALRRPGGDAVHASGSLGAFGP
jgi:tetratricopeptide (TPR) repeat protein